MPMSKIKSPQEKKRESLVHDRRNTFGESPHAARKSIPKRKAMQHQQERRIASQTLSQVPASTDADAIEFLEGEAKSRARAKRVSGFKKYPDQPLGEVIKAKEARRIKQAGRHKHNREQVNEYVLREGITPVLNNTKWERLFELLQKSERFFQYRRTNLDGSTFPEDGASFTPELAQYWGDFWAMEWLDILSYQTHSKGALLAPDIEDFTSELVALANEVGVKFTMIERGIRVWGYVRKGNSPDFVQR